MTIPRTGSWHDWHFGPVDPTHALTLPRAGDAVDPGRDRGGLVTSADAPRPHTLADGGELLFVPRLFAPVEADALFALLRDTVPWEQMRFRGHPEPRLTYWMGEFDYRYSGVTRRAAPWSEATRSIRSMVERLVFGASEGQYQGVLLNYYHTGDDRIGFHSDDEPVIRQHSPIASVSLGAAHRFVLKHKEIEEVVELPLTAAVSSSAARPRPGGVSVVPAQKEARSSQQRASNLVTSMNPSSGALLWRGGHRASAITA